MTAAGTTMSAPLPCCRQVKQDAAEAAVRPKAASPSRLDQDTLLATLWVREQQ